MLQRLQRCFNGGILTVLIVVLFGVAIDAFQTSTFGGRTTTIRANTGTRTQRQRSLHSVQLLRLSSSSSSSNSEVEALLAAAAKAREEANRLAEVLIKCLRLVRILRVSKSLCISHLILFSFSLLQLLQYNRNLVSRSQPQIHPAVLRHRRRVVP